MSVKVRFTSDMVAAIDDLRARGLPWIIIAKKIGVCEIVLRKFRRRHPNPAWVVRVRRRELDDDGTSARAVEAARRLCVTFGRLQRACR